MKFHESNEESQVLILMCRWRQVLSRKMKRTHELAYFLSLIVNVILDIEQVGKRLVDLALQRLHVKLETGQLVDQLVLHLH